MVQLLMFQELFNSKKTIWFVYYSVPSCGLAEECPRFYWNQLRCLLYGMFLPEAIAFSSINRWSKSLPAGQVLGRRAWNRYGFLECIHMPQKGQNKVVLQKQWGEWIIIVENKRDCIVDIISPFPSCISAITGKAERTLANVLETISKSLPHMVSCTVLVQRLHNFALLMCVDQDKGEENSVRQTRTVES